MRSVPLRRIQPILSTAWMHMVVLLALASSALAQETFRTEPLSTRAASAALVAAGVPVSPAQFAADFSLYLDQLQELTIRNDAEIVRVREHARVPPGGYLNARDVARVQEIRERHRKEHAALIAAWAERVKGTVPEVHAGQLERVRDYLQFKVLAKQVEHIGAPWDISDYVHVGLSKDSAQYAQIAQSAHLSSRVGAYEEFAKAANEAELARAAQVEEAGAVGMTRDQVTAEERAISGELSKTHNSADWPAERERLQARLQKLRSVMRYPRDAWTSQRIAILREQLMVLRDLEAAGWTETAEDAVASTWLPALLESWGSEIPMFGPDGKYGARSPRELVRDLLRLKQLTDEQRAKLRVAGREFIKAYWASQRARLERAVASGSMSDARPDGVWILKQISLLGAAIDMPDLGKRGEGLANAPFPKGELLESLSDEDSAAFGKVWLRADMPKVYQRAHARYEMLPAPYTKESAAELTALLAIASADVPVAESLFADATIRWDARVKPLVEQCEIRRLEHNEDYDRLYRAEVDRSAQAREVAFAAAAECDAQLAEALNAALGQRMDRAALAAWIAGCRTAESLNHSMWAGEILDCPRAVLEAPLAPSARRKLLDGFAPLAERWRTLGVDMLKARLALHVLEQTGEQDEPSPHIEGSAERFKRAHAMHQAADAAWAAADRDTEEQLVALLTEPDAALFRAWLRRLRWPRFYSGLEDLRTTVAEMVALRPDASELLRAVDETLARAQPALQRTGDLAVQMLARGGVNPHVSQSLSFSSARTDWALRTQPLRMVNDCRVELVKEQLRAVLPPEVADKLWGRSVFAAHGSPLPAQVPSTNAN